jgi:NitT/TauT family transport system substrate-binding protein
MRILGLATAALLVASQSVALAQSKMTVGYTSLSGVAPIFVAKEQGQFDKRGLNVELLAMRGGNVLVPSLVAGSIQVATLTAPSLVQAIDGGIELVGLTSLSVLSTGMTNTGVLARTGVEIKSAKDFEGKRVAVATIGSISDILFQKWMALKGANPKLVKFVEVSFPQMPDVIKTGNIDAVVIPDPLMTAILKAGSGYVVSYFFGEMPDNTRAMVSAASRAWAAQNARDARAYQDAIAEAATWANANPSETKAIIGKWLKLSPELMAATQIEKMVAELTASDFTWWLGTMNEQGLLRTSIDAGKIISP